jgi:hypothetical protein
MAALPAVVLAPAAGALHAAPPIPAELMALVPAIGAAALSTCHAVTTGPDRNLYWVYSTLHSSATAITTPTIVGACFETRQSITISQGKTRATQICSTCGKRLISHMTTIQANASFVAHAGAFPATHTTLNTIPAPGTTAPAGYATINGITAPVAAPFVIPLPAALPAPLPLGVPAAQFAPAAAAAPIGPAAPSSRPSLSEFKAMQSIATGHAKWKRDTIAHEFIQTLESALDQSPIDGTHWIYIIPMMISDRDPNVMEWVRTNITTPALSWNAAKAAFIGHYQKADWVDTRRKLYDTCTEGKDESVQSYTDRYMALTHQLGLADGDQLNIQHFLNGLRRPVHMKLTELRSNMRKMPSIAGGIPVSTWDFTSLQYTTDQAIAYDAELSLHETSQRTATSQNLPAYVRNSALANPVTTSSTSTMSNQKFGKKRREEDISSTEVENRSKRAKTGDKICEYHPGLTSHSTEDCRKGKKMNSKIQTNEKTTISAGNYNPPKTPSSITSSKTRTPQQDLSHIPCFKCEKFGHYANQCPERDSSQAKEGSEKKNNKKKTKANGIGVKWLDGLTEGSAGTSMSLTTSSMPSTSQTN